MDRFPVELDLEDVRLEAAAFAFRAAHEDVAEELHLDLLEAVAAAALAAPSPALKENALAVSPCATRIGRAAKSSRMCIEDAEVDAGRGARRARERRLIDHHHLVDLVRADRASCRRRALPRSAGLLRARRFPIEHVVHERALARAGNAGDAGEDAERKLDIDFAQVVLARAFDARCSRAACGASSERESTSRPVR